MGTFMNHKTNLSQLELKLQTIGRQIADAIEHCDGDNEYDKTHSPSTSSSSSSSSLLTRRRQEHQQQLQRKQQAEYFINTQRERVTRVERDLFRLTWQVLPGDDETTIAMTSLSRAIQEMQNCYIRQLHDLCSQIDPSFSNQQEQQEQDSPTNTTPVPQHWTVGRILTAVPETDHETDSSVVASGKSAASSNFFKSPPNSAVRASPWSSSHKKRNGTPFPIDERDGEQDEFVENQHAHQRELLQHQQPTSNPVDPLDEFSLAETLLLSPPIAAEHHLSLASQSMLDSPLPPKQKNGGLPKQPSSGQKRVNAFAKLEQKFRRQVFNESESSSYDLNNDISNDEPLNDQSYHGNDEEEDEDETMESMAPTIVKNGSANESQEVEEESMDDSALYTHTIVQSKKMPPNPRTGPRPSQIEFGPRDPTSSPAMSSVNSTVDFDLDGTMMDLTTQLDKTMAGLETVKEASPDDEDDASSKFSTETPVLDRYRLDTDLVVRPNPRGRHHRQKVKLPPLSGTVSLQRKSLDKAQQRASLSTTTTIIDENAPLNFATEQPASKPQTTAAARPTNPLRQPLVARQPQSLHQTLASAQVPSPTSRRETYQDPSTGMNESMPPPSPRQSSSITQKSSHRPLQSPDIAKTTSPTNHRLDVGERLCSPNDSARQPDTQRTTPKSKAVKAPRLYQSLSGAPTEGTDTQNVASDRRATFQPSQVTGKGRSPRHLAEKKNRPLKERIQIHPITSQEYEDSPRIVKMQVTFAQVQQAVVLLNQAWSNDPHLPCTLDEDQIALIWDSIITHDKQPKKLLLSLCHWRRLESLKKADEGAPHPSVYRVVLSHDT